VLLAAGIVTVILISIVEGRKGPGRTPIVVAVEWFVCLALLVAGLLLFIVRARLNRRGVIINHRGVTFDTPTISVRFLPWSDNGHARFDWKAERFQVDGFGQTPLVVCEGEDLSTNTLSDRCAYEINELKAVYAEISP
jgi:hypothetical protein